MSSTVDQVVPIFHRPGVHRLLLTFDSSEQLGIFHDGMCGMVNLIEVRENTAFYTVYDEQLDAAIESAIFCRLTVQQRLDTETAPFWALVVKGDAAPWFK